METQTAQELVGVKEIARRAKVSIGTVDRVIHNRKGVSAKTKSKILAIIEELNYQPNIFARRLASKKILHIAVLIPAVSPETDYWSAPLNGIDDAEAEIKAYGIVIDKYLFDQDDKQTFLAQATLMLKNKVDGVLIAPLFIEESKNIADQCIHLNIPYVFINSDLPGYKSLCYIGPELYASGKLGAHLVNYLLVKNEKVLIVNIARELDSLHHLLRKEEGFRAYFTENQKENEILKLDIRNTDYENVKAEVGEVLANNEIKVIFVTNSRVSFIAKYIEEKKIKGIKLVGYDFLQENISYLDAKTIEFLISQKPKEQGYRGIMTLYNYLVHSQLLDSAYYMPIDIITKENYSFYKN
ncbi:LacI family DNA-binding transcriptional regulator [Pedobacter mucosus]|uniref:LacI family DNA-binding transcriptional regulator n=1 Tax=Pedobacter mucosus TaxID=2895286 RepID=UPI001EE49B28|nr:substrate-binding domain-containing protein [Pedobacter mucosus]UKT66129.1 substrate-binding domain-containing protein [Pedobacter mucosus]